MNRFFNLDTAAYRDGALDGRTKELLGLVASAVLRCNDCIDYHLGQCVEAGWNDEELLDALNVALVVGGSIVIPHMRHAVETIDALRTFSLGEVVASQHTNVESSVSLALKLTAPLREGLAAPAVTHAEACGAVAVGHAELVQVLFAVLSNASLAIRDAALSDEEKQATTIEVRARREGDTRSSQRVPRASGQVHRSAFRALTKIMSSA